MSNAAVNPPSPAPAADVSGAQALVRAGKFEEALTVLRPLARGRAVEANVLFLIGMAATGASQQPDLADDERDALLDEAIAALHTMLIDRPDLVRVRLELARAFFLKGEDSLARSHFERVLAGKPVAPVVANVQRFLAEIRARRRWTMYLGAAMSPDSNIGGASDEQIIYINDLPFRRDAEELTTSGIGVSVWTGGEYQHPLGDRLRLRLGGDLSRQDYGGRKFDQTFCVGSYRARAGWWTRIPRSAWSATPAAAGPARAPSNDDLGARVEAGHRLTPRIRVNGRASWYHRDYRTRDFLDGPILDFTLGGSWVILPILRADGAAGYARERPESERWRNASRWLRLGASVALPLGFTVGGSGELRWTNYEGNWFPFTRDGVPREDRTRILRATVHNRAFTLYRLQSATGGDERGAGHQRAALRLQTHPGRAARRAAVLGTAVIMRRSPGPPSDVLAPAKGAATADRMGNTADAPPCPNEACARPGRQARPCLRARLLCSVARVLRPPPSWPGAQLPRRCGSST